MMEALDKFAELMIKKISEVDKNWQQPWFSTRGVGLPQNISGREYNGMNSFMLYLNGEEKGYSCPVYATFNQVKEENLSVTKGEKAFPVVYWNFTIKNDKGERISLDDYKALSKEKQKEYKVAPFLKYYNVFNIDQTNIKEQKPELYEKLKRKFAVPELKDEKGMCANKELDTMIDKKAWYCPVNLEASNRAFYSPATDSITVPIKAQFKDGESFYGTLLHEMAHSTGSKGRLNRIESTIFGDPKYAKEELVAEMTSAVTSQSLGITTGIKEENAKYLKNWLSAMKEEPKFIISILSDVGKASNMINDRLNEKELTKTHDKSMGITI
jgi:antirestriction protein ArdC